MVVNIFSKIDTFFIKLFFCFLFAFLCCSCSSRFENGGIEPVNEEKYDYKGKDITPELIDSVYVLYDKALRTSQKVVYANSLMKMIDDAESLDTVFVIDKSMSRTIMDFYVHYAMMYYYYHNTMYLKASEYLSEVETNIDKVSDVTLKSDICSLIGALYCRNGDVYKSMEYFKKCYEIDFKLDDLERISSDLNNIANLCVISKQFNAAEYYILDAIDIERKLRRADKLAIRLATASTVYLKLNRPEDALRYIYESLNIEKLNGRENMVAVRKSQLADIYINMNMIDQADEILLEALPVLEKSTNRNSLAIVFCQLGEVSLKKNKLHDAEKFLLSAVEISKNIGSLYIERRAVKDLYLVKKDFSPVVALQYLEQYTVFSDSIFKEDLSQTMSMFQALYNNVELDKQNKIEKSRNHTILFVSIVVVTLLVMFIIFLFFMLRVHTKEKKQMKAMEDMRSKFFSNITHEFRTPLTVILGVAHQMVNECNFNDSQMRAMHDVYHQGDVLLNLVDKLIDVSKIKSGVDNSEFYNGNVVEYLKVIVSYFESYAAQKEIDISFASSKQVINMDFVPDYLSKIIQILVGNALINSQKNGNVYITVQEKKKNLLLVISDNGDGIDSETLQHLFDDFYYDGNFGTIGRSVEFSLVKQIVLAFKGNVVVKSALGQGSVFLISLPLRHGKGNYKPFAVEDINNKGIFIDNRDFDADIDKELCDNKYSPVILVVDDNKDVKRFIGSQLRDKYNVYYAKNGREGLERAREILPDIIISDVDMPEMDGFEFCKAVRSEDSIAHTSFLLVSAIDSNADRIKANDVGADDFLLKPFDIDELRSDVASMLKRKAVLRENFLKSVIDNASADGNVTPIDTDNASKADKEFIKKMVDVVYKQMDQGYVDIELIAKMFDVSTKQLSRRVFTITGDTLSAYVLKIRISKAKLMLKNNLDMSIGDIAMKCGFEDNAHFTRSFKKITNETPSQYRKVNV